MKLSLQLDKNGKAGDVQDKTIPKLNAPIVAKKEIHYFAKANTRN